MKCLIMAALLMGLNAQAQVVKDLSLQADLRGDTVTTTDVAKLQGRIRIGFTVDVNGLLEVVGLATTGSGFNGDWATLKASDGNKDEMSLAFRNIYLRKVVGKVTAEAGALSPEKSVGGAGFQSLGWIDGIRVKVDTKIGPIKVVAGSLGDFKQPDAFSRKFDGNFLELEIERKFLDKIITQTALEHYDGDLYLRENAKMDVEAFGHMVFQVFAAALYDFEREAMTYEVGAEFDLLKNLVQRHEKRLEVKAYFSDVDERMPNRNSTISGHFTYGPRVTVQAGGKLDRKGNATWFARSSLGEKRRHSVGVSVKVPVKKTKP